MAHRLLVIEPEVPTPDASVCAALANDSAYRCESIAWDRVAPHTLRESGVHAVVAVAVPPTPKSMRVFEWLHEHTLPVPTLAVLSSASAEGLLRLAADVADDFLLCPLHVDELRQRLARVLGAMRHDLAAVRQSLLEEMSLTRLSGSDPVFLSAIENVPRFARSDMPVLITGETGTGKELCARAIHHLGKRRNFPFIAVDCSALPDHLFENEMFGHVRGAFTDAHRDQRGLVAMAEGGTLFLDEVDSLSFAAQSKLLRLLQEYTYRRLGGDRFLRADVNVIAATNQDLEGLVRNRTFRSDLYFRLNVLRLHLPPLRERHHDIELLACRFLEERRATAPTTARSISRAALRALAQHDWPGNVRELHNVVQRAAAICDGTQILPSQLALPGLSAACQTKGVRFHAARAAAVEAFERRYVEDLLRSHNGNVTHAAREAGKERRAFGRLIKKYRIDRRML